MMKDDFERAPTGTYQRHARPAKEEVPEELLLLFSEAVSMAEARWGNLSSPRGQVFRNFSRCSRPGFSPRFGSGDSAAPRPAADGLEVCREIEGWLLELVFDPNRVTYQELADRFSGILEVLRQA